MLKNIIAPVQAWLLSQGKCVGCGKKLTKYGSYGFAKTYCTCGRVYMYDHESNKFRRATLDEIK